MDEEWLKLTLKELLEHPQKIIRLQAEAMLETLEDIKKREELYR